MKFVLDVHTHTTASGHAYSTLLENVAYASRAGLELLGITDHAPAMEGGTKPSYFLNFSTIPREIDGLQLVMGAELNIMDYDGNVDLDVCYLPVGGKEETEKKFAFFPFNPEEEQKRKSR